MLHRVSVGCQVLPPAPAGVVGDEGLLLYLGDAHGLCKLVGPLRRQAHVTCLKLKFQFLSAKWDVLASSRASHKDFLWVKFVVHQVFHQIWLKIFQNIKAKRTDTSGGVALRYGTISTFSMTSLHSWTGLAMLRTAATAPLASARPSITSASISTSPLILSTDPHPEKQFEDFNPVVGTFDRRF